MVYHPRCSSPASSTDSKHDGNSNIENLALKCAHAIVYVEGKSTSRRVFDYKSFRALLKAFIRDLKGGTVDQVCLIANEEHMTRPRSAEPKSAREERFASQSWEALRET